MSKVKVVLNNVLYPYMKDSIEESKKVLLSFNEQTTIQELFELSGESCADLSKYCNVSRGYYFNCRSLPYIFDSEGNVLWEPHYDEIKVVDFIRTYSVRDNTVYADTGIPQAGGPDLKDLVQLWEEYYPILEQIGTTFGFVSGIVGIGRWIRSLFKKKNPPPQTIFDLLLSREQWNHFELAESLEIDKDEMKKLLQVFGYKWDNSKRLYVQQGNTEEIIQKLAQVSFFEHG